MNDAKINLVLPEYLKEELRQAAADAGVSMATYLRWALRDMLRRSSIKPVFKVDTQPRNTEDEYLWDQTL